jgi:hypothetical protein
MAVSHTGILLTPQQYAAMTWAGFIGMPMIKGNTEGISTD